MLIAGRGAHRPTPGALAARAAARALVAACICATGGICAATSWESHRYEELRVLSADNGSAVGAEGAQLPDGTAAMLEVRGTEIFYPVMELERGQDPSFYLSHNAWGEPSGAGCPFLDPQSGGGAAHLLVYAHGSGVDGGQFAALRDAYRPDVFGGIGEARWMTPSGEEVSFSPLCALHVDAAFAGIQRFDLADGLTGAFALELARRAPARSENWGEQAASSTRVLTLATCSQPLPGTRERTLVVFTA